MALAQQEAPKWTLKLPNYDAEQLLRVELKTTDFAKVDAASSTPPLEGEELTYALLYELDKEVPCSFGGHRHKKGYILKDRNGALYRAGHICGKSLFGLDFKEMSDNFTRMVRRQLDLVRLARIREALIKHSDWIADLPQCAAVQSFESFRRDFTLRHGLLYSRLKQAAERRLIGVAHVRDLVAERQRDEKARENAEVQKQLSGSMLKDWFRRNPPSYGRGGPIFRAEKHDFGEVAGAALFVLAGAEGNALGAAGQAAKLGLQLANLDKSDAELREMSVTAGRLLSALSLVSLALDSISAFLSAGSVERIAAWANSLKIDDAEYARVDGGLEISAGGERSILSVPPEIRMDRRPFVELRAAIKGDDVQPEVRE